MTQTSLLMLSKQGNADAIATLMNRPLKNQGIVARVSLKNRHLKVLLEAAQVPDQKTLVPFVVKGLRALELPSIDTIQIFGRQTGETFPAWSKTIPSHKLTPGIQTIAPSARETVIQETITIPDSAPAAVNARETMILQEKIPIPESESPSPNARETIIQEITIPGSEPLVASFRDTIIQEIEIPEVDLDAADSQPAPGATGKTADQNNLEALTERLMAAIDDGEVVLNLSLEDSTLKVTAVTSKVLSGASFVKKIQQSLGKPQDVTQVEVYKHKPRGSYPYRLGTFTPIPLPEDQPLTETVPIDRSTKTISIAAPIQPPSVASRVKEFPSPSTLKEASTSPSTPKKKANINKIRKILTIALFSAVAGFVLFRLAVRMTWLFTTPTGGIGIIFGLFFLWRAYAVLAPMVQHLLRGE